MSTQGGPVPFPEGFEWGCRYSEPRIAKNRKNLEEVAVYVNCKKSDARFSFMLRCGRMIQPGAPTDPFVATDTQAVTLYSVAQTSLVGVTCAIPAASLETAATAAK